MVVDVAPWAEVLEALVEWCGRYSTSQDKPPKRTRISLQVTQGPRNVEVIHLVGKFTLAEELQK